MKKNTLIELLNSLSFSHTGTKEHFINPKATPAMQDAEFVKLFTLSNNSSQNMLVNKSELILINL